MIGWFILGAFVAFDVFVGLWLRSLDRGGGT